MMALLETLVLRDNRERPAPLGLLVMLVLRVPQDLGGHLVQLE